MIITKYCRVSVEYYFNKIYGTVHANVGQKMIQK